jgi:hypothetical protein
MQTARSAEKRRDVGINLVLRNGGVSYGRIMLHHELTGFLQTYFAIEVMNILGVPKDAGWYIHRVVAMGYPTGKGESVLVNRSTRWRHAIAGRVT